MAVGDVGMTWKHKGAPALERVQLFLARAWRIAVRITAVTMPAWPLWGGVVLAGWALFLTGQGRQALIAVLAGDGERRMMLGATIALFALHSFSVCVGFLEATRHRDEVRGESLRRHRLRRRVAMVTALLLPVALLAFVIVNAPAQYAGNPLVATPALISSASLIVFLLVFLPFFSLRYFRVKDTAFGQIATLDGKATTLLTLFGVAGASFAAAAGYLPSARNAIGPVAIFVLAVTVYGLWMTRGVTWLRVRQLPPLPIWIAALLAGGVLYAQISGRPAYHAIETINSDEAPTPIKEYARAWLEERRSEGGDIPAIIVLAEGGGIYAAHNVSSSLAQLDALSGDEIYRHVFALSGVSGGSIGITTYLAARADIDDPAKRVDAITAFMANDFLSPLAAGLLFRDIPFRFAPGADLLASAAGLAKKDRARLFEEELSRRWLENCAAKSGADCKDRFRESIFTVADAARRDGVSSGPVVLLNAARESDGRVETISNASFESNGDEGLYNLLDRLKDDGKTIPLGAAAHVSARFPIISPRAIAEVGSKGERVTLVDGGYADNSGATSATIAIEALRDQARSLGLVDRLKIIVIHYYSRAIIDDETTSRSVIGDRVDVVAEIFGPVRAALAVQSRRSAGPVEILCRAASTGNEVGEFCRSLTGPREFQKEQSHLDARDKIVSPISVGPDGVIWLRSPLDISVRASDGGFVPLGWYLGGSGNYVAKETCRRSKRVHLALTKATGSEAAVAGSERRPTAPQKSQPCAQSGAPTIAR